MILPETLLTELDNSQLDELNAALAEAQNELDPDAPALSVVMSGGIPTFGYSGCSTMTLRGATVANVWGLFRSISK